MEKLTYAQVRSVPLDVSYLLLDPRADWYGLRQDGMIVCFVGLMRTAQGRLRTRAAYTRPEYRGRGFFSRLLAELIAPVREDLYGSCMQGTLKIYLRLGYKVYREKEYKLGKIWYVKRPANDLKTHA